ncbi:hypothetical protein IWX49DRAFT_196766 [Phyllosticta citricarpa]
MELCTRRHDIFLKRNAAHLLAWVQRFSGPWKGRTRLVSLCFIQGFVSGGCWTDAKDERTQWRHDTTLEDKMTRWKAGRSFLSLFSLQHVTLFSPFPRCLLCAVCVGSKRRQALGSWELEIATAVLGSSKEQKISKKREKRGSLQICDVGWKATGKFRDGRSATCTTGCRPCQGGSLLGFSLIIIYGRLWRIKLDELHNGARRINGESFTCKGQ